MRQGVCRAQKQGVGLVGIAMENISLPEQWQMRRDYGIISPAPGQCSSAREDFKEASAWKELDME